VEAPLPAISLYINTHPLSLWADTLSLRIALYPLVYTQPIQSYSPIL